MSSLIAIQTNEQIIFASDTALSAQFKEKTYRVSNDEQKLFEYEDFIMFASGKKEIRDTLLTSIGLNPTIEDIVICLNEKILPISEEFSLEVVIALKNESKLIFLSSNDGYLYSENVCRDSNTHLFTAGYRTEEISNIFTNELIVYPVYQALTTTFKKVVCNEIGGNIDVFHIHDSKVKKKRIKIDDFKTYSDEEIINSLNLVFANRLYGSAILGNNLRIESDSGIFTINGATQTVYDNKGVKKIELGKYQNPDSPSLYKYGMRVYDGAIDIRTSSSANRGTQLDGDGFRAFNNNGVRTFNVNATTGQVEIIGDLTIKSSPSSYRGVVITSSGITGYNASGGITFELNANSGKMTSQENFLIQTSTSPNRGVKIDDYGIRGYNTGGTKTFEIDVYGNATFSGNITASNIYGTSINGGSISGTTISGNTITGNTINGGSINGTTITGSTINGNDINGGTISGTTITGNTINGGTINGTTINGTKITSADINISEEATIGNWLNLGTRWNDPYPKGIRFGGGAGGSQISYRDDMINISAMSGVKIPEGLLFIGNETAVSSNYTGMRLVWNGAQGGEKGGRLYVRNYSGEIGYIELKA